MITRFSLYLRNRSKQKKPFRYKETISYDNSEQIGILITQEKLSKNRTLLNNIIKELEAEGKEVSVLVFYSGKKQSRKGFSGFNTGDISLHGKIKKESIAYKFANKHFDYLLCFEKDPHPAIINVLAKSKAKCRVGAYHPGNEAFFEMMIQGENKEPAHLIEQIKNYTKNIKKVSS